jgi:hypothetical protein
LEVGEPADGRQESLLRFFGIDAHFDGVSVERHFVLRQRQIFASGDTQLPLHEVKPSDHLGDRMLHLQARVHLHEVEVALGVGDELHSSGAHIADGPCGITSRAAHGSTLCGVDAGRGRFLDDFLMAALRRAVTLIEADGVTGLVGEDLDFDVPRLKQVLLDQHIVIAERRARFALARGQCGRKFIGRVDYAHAFAAAASRSLDEHRIADTIGFTLQQRWILVRAVIPRHQRHLGFLHQRLGGGFQAHGEDAFHRRTDEDNAVRLAGAGESFVLGEKAVTRVNGLRAGLFANLDDALDPQITFA